MPRAARRLSRILHTDVLPVGFLAHSYLRQAVTNLIPLSSLGTMSDCPLTPELATRRRG